jgi:hypothetical protein
MAIRSYHDFILFTYGVEEDEHRRIRSFKVRVFDSPVGQGEEEEAVPVDDYERLQEMSRCLEEREFDGDIALQRNVGTRLGELLLPSRARAMFFRSYNWLKQDEGLRLRLRLEEELSHLPWEFIYLDHSDGQSTVGGFVVLNPRISIVRHEALALPAAALSQDDDRTAPAEEPPRADDHTQPVPVSRGAGRPVMRAEWLPPPAPAESRRVVIAMATPRPYGTYPPLELLPEEQKGIREALGRIQGVDVDYVPEYRAPEDYQAVSGATLPDLQDTLREGAEIFHFSGHGEFEKALGPGGTSIEGHGWLILADENNLAHRVSADAIRELVADNQVRLVVLGACESARRDRFQKLSSVSVSLLKGRVPCVVAMQFIVKSVLASAFMEAFYQALVAGLEIDEAVALGRAAVWNRTLGDGTHRRDWGVPVLYLRTPGGRIFHPVTHEQARKEAEQRSRERYDLNASWWDWMARDDFATEEQLERLAAAGDRLELSPVQALLLLRSAVKRDVSPTPWLGRLDRMREATLAQLGDLEGEASGPQAQARKILGLDGSLLESLPQDVDPLAWSAVRNEDGSKRQTAALVVTALKPSRREGIEELESALAQLGRWRAWRRRAELRGVLADADQEIEELNRGLRVWDRVGVWGWRVWRRLRRDRRSFGWLMAGGTIGAGLGLGALRFVLAFLFEFFGPQPVLPGVQFGMYLYWGAILGFFLCLGLLLADPLLLRRLDLAGRKTPAGPDRRRALLAVGLGTLFAGITLLIESWLNGLQIAGKPLVAPLGFLFGLGLSLALYGQPASGRRWHLGRALVRLGVAVATSLLTQLTFILARDKGVGIAIAWPGSRYNAFLSSLLDYQWPELTERVPLWADYLGLLDAALVGAVLAAGITLGMQVALRRFCPEAIVPAGEEKGGEP